ncbi:deoxyuridine 5'-triphosphate nucleotidohydrolase [Streptococcus pneumoniae]|nr:deoxyuridine 5'-triphosphate nucleotidohydrolase [Streptococcus pneumoniae]
MKIRGFELVSSFTDENLLPKRETAHAAGYDLKSSQRTEQAGTTSNQTEHWQTSQSSQ